MSTRWRMRSGSFAGDECLTMLTQESKMNLICVLESFEQPRDGL